MKTVTLDFVQIARASGFESEAGGKLNLPATQQTADRLAEAAVQLLGEWTPGTEPSEVILSGPGPVWGYLAIAHALHGRVVRLTYMAPNATICIYAHGVPA
jgi:hypothetical protein